MVCWWKGRYFLRPYTIASRIRLRTVYTGIADTLTIVRCEELYALAEFRKQEYGYYNINLLGICLTAIMPIRGKQRAHDGQAPCPSWASSVPLMGIIAVRQMPQNFISSHQQTIQTIGWQSPDSQRSVCQNVTAKNLTIWQFWLFFENITFMANWGGEFTSSKSAAPLKTEAPPSGI